MENRFSTRSLLNRLVFFNKTVTSIIWNIVLKGISDKLLQNASSEATVPNNNGSIVGLLKYYLSTWIYVYYFQEQNELKYW